MNGIVDVITLLLGLSGFGLQQNPKPATVDAALEYAIPDADLVVHFDAASVIPGNYRALVALPHNPAIEKSPELAKMVREAVTEVDSARGLVKTMTGIDLATDIADATLSVQLRVPGDDPDAVVAVHGKFTADTIDKIAGLTRHQATRLARGAAQTDIDDKTAVAVTADGVLLVGTKSLVSARTAPGWRAPAHAPGTSLGYAADAIAQRPVFAVSMTLSQTARAKALADLGPDQTFGTDVIRRHKAVGFALYHDGIGWTWVDSTRAGLDAMADISDGTVQLLTAAAMAPRGVAKIALGALESYRSNPRIDALLRQHKADLVKIIDTYLGDGVFKSKVDKDVQRLRLNVRLTGKNAASVVPLALLVPAGAWFALRSEASEPVPPPQMQIAPPPPIPATGRRMHK